MTAMRLGIVLVAFLAFALAGTGCASVPAYDRGLLAHKSMSPGELAPPSEVHVRAVHEGTLGGGFAAGGGCGCN
jgi:hypothetical protein